MMSARYKAWALALPLAAALGLAPAAPGFAHHSSFMYDMETEVTLDGVVKEFQYTNPHSWLLVDVTEDDGTVTTWGFEAEGPSTLMRAGIRKSDLREGTMVTVTGHPMKDGRPAAALVKAVREDGSVFNPRAGFQIR